MTWKEKIDTLIIETPEEQIDSSAFWRGLLEDAFSHLPPNSDNLKYIDALSFMFFSALTFEETKDTFNPTDVLRFFLHHVAQWNDTSSINIVAHLKPIPDESTPA